MKEIVKNGEDEVDKVCKTFQETSELPETSESLKSVFNGMVNSLKQQIPTTEVRAKDLGDENLREAKELGTRSTETYQELKENLIEICNRGFGGKTYKQKTQTFLIKHKLILKEYSEHIKFLKKYRTKLLLRNKLLNGLFTGAKNTLEFTQDDITPKNLLKSFTTVIPMGNTVFNTFRVKFTFSS